MATEPARVESVDRARPEVSGGEADRPQGHGRRLTAAFDALERFPALAESRDRLLGIVSAERVPVGELITAVEGDAGLLIAALRIANSRVSNRRRGVATARGAVDALTPAGVEVLAGAVSTYDFFEASPGWHGEPERFRLHAVATQRAADRIAVELERRDRDELAVVALVHDVGKLVLSHAYAGYPDEVHRGARGPDECLRAERRELGVDHAMVGGVLIRRWGLPDELASTIERHHREDADGRAGIIRLADLLAHYGAGEALSRVKVLAAAEAVGLDASALRSVMFDLSSQATTRRHADEPCPLSPRELEVLGRLAEGKVYKQIAMEVGLSTSTVRTHLHNIYGKLGAVDRAQAVLMATERGWL